MGYSNCQNDLRSPYVHSSSIPITRSDRHVPTVRNNSKITDLFYNEFLETIRQLIDQLNDLNTNLLSSCSFFCIHQTLNFTPKFSHFIQRNKQISSSSLY
jgi:hypothetical protein